MFSSTLHTHTFLFTDIEGSTRRWEADRAAMSAALARHDAILRAATEGQGGTVFKTVGDAFCAVFADPVAALGAAVAAQRTLAEEDWGAIGLGVGDAITHGGPDAPATFGALRVRMALHSGLAEERGGDYFGPTLNRVARLLAAGHGGQVLLSAVTEGLLSGHLPPGVTLRDLGEHRLKDLARAERVWQVAAEGLAASFAPLRGLDARPHNLPVQPTALIGREAELDELGSLLRAQAGPRLVTLTGPGGTGKTRLALQAAADLLDDFEDGVFLVDLSSCVDVQRFPAMVAADLGIREEPGESVIATLKRALAGKRQLLLLDNFEQILPAAKAVAELLAALSQLRILVTSRAALQLRGERELAVGSLPLPDPPAVGDAGALLRSAAVRLFLERARDVRPDFVVSTENATAIAGICARLDGLPLALELAAARLRMLTPQSLLARLQARLALLTGGNRDLPARQQTMRDTIAWSYDLLDAREQRVFRGLGVFRGGWTLEAAEAVLDPDGRLAVFEALDRLLAASLVRVVHQADGGQRFAMLELLREFAAEALEAEGEAEALRARHAAWYADLARTFENEVYWQGDEVKWMSRLRAEDDNLRAAVERSLATSALHRTAVTLMAWLPRYSQHIGGDYGTSVQWLQAASALAGDTIEAEDALVRYWLSAAYSRTGRAGDAVAGLLEAEQAFARLGDELHLAWFYNDLGVVATYSLDLAAAAGYFERSLALKRQAGTHHDQAIALSNLAEICFLQGDHDQAVRLLQDALAILTEPSYQRSDSLRILAMADLLHGRLDGARAALREALESFPGEISGFELARCCCVALCIASASNEPELVANYRGAIARLTEENATTVDPLYQEAMPAAIEVARMLLSAEAWAAAEEAGRHLTPEKLITLARGEVADV